MNEEILGGLKSALERGQSLKNSMTSLFNAGYKKAEIEEAARALAEPINLEGKIISESAIPPAPPKDYSAPQIEKPVKQIFKKLVPEEKKQISDYPQKSSKNKSLIILLICILVFLGGILTLLFAFRNDLINLLNQIFL